MSRQFHRASTGDTVTVPDALVDKYEADPSWEPVKTKSKASASTSKEKS